MSDEAFWFGVRLIAAGLFVGGGILIGWTIACMGGEA